MHEYLAVFTAVNHTLAGRALQVLRTLPPTKRTRGCETLTMPIRNQWQLITDKNDMLRCNLRYHVRMHGEQPSQYLGLLLSAVLAHARV